MLEYLNKKPGIYKITNIKNGKVYIGSSLNLKTRIQKHFADLKNNKHHSVHLQRAYNKYGINSFKYEILEFIYFNEDRLVLKKELLDREQYWMDIFQSYKENFGYNICEKADSNLGTKRSDEEKRKMSESRKGKKRNAEASNNIRNGVILARGIRVINLDTNRIFECIAEANRFYNINVNIKNTCLGHKGKAGGYRWAFASKDNKIIPYVYNSKKSKLFKKIINITTGRVFNSISEAAIEYKVLPSTIIRVCQGKTYSCVGYRFAYLDNNDNPIIVNTKDFKFSNKKVRNIETKNIFNSISEASRIMNIDRSSISNVCSNNGKSKTAGGFHWEYFIE